MDTGPERAETVGRRGTCTRPRSPLTLPNDVTSRAHGVDLHPQDDGDRLQAHAEGMPRRHILDRSIAAALRRARGGTAGHAGGAAPAEVALVLPVRFSVARGVKHDLIVLPEALEEG